ncbi:MAG: hypothetical protein ACYTET_03085 [Planctomycetota bacterium]|jgi:hypothetical protein
MEKDILIGIILVSVAWTTVAAMTWWSRGSIERIASDGCKTARQTLKKGKTNGQ